MTACSDIFLQPLPDHLRREDLSGPRQKAKAVVIARFFVRNWRLGQSLANEIGNDLTRSRMAPLGELFRRRQHILIDIKRGPHASNASASDAVAQDPYSVNCRASDIAAADKAQGLWQTTTFGDSTASNIRPVAQAKLDIQQLSSLTAILA